MASHAQRLDAARGAINYICSRSTDDMTRPVPNCPGWTVYNAAVHIGRVGIAWHSMIDATPDDPDSRVRGYADAEARGSGHQPDVLASWALAAVDALDDDLERACYFSMTGGSGTVALWGWHAATELGLHRLDIEAALGAPYAMSDDLAIDALDYTVQYFLPAMVQASDARLEPLHAVAVRDGHTLGSFRAGASDEDPAATISGAPVDVLLALWGRPHGALDVAGPPEVMHGWHTLPSTAFQFGTWD